MTSLAYRRLEDGGTWEGDEVQELDSRLRVSVLSSVWIVDGLSLWLGSDEQVFGLWKVIDWRRGNRYLWADEMVLVLVEVGFFVK